MISIEQFCDKHRACCEGRDWALDNCDDMADAWSKLKPEWLIWVATRPGVLTDRELRLFAVFCARQVSHLLTDQRSLRAIDVAGRFANGQASKEELAPARDAAWAAAGAAEAAACAAARAARGAASAAAWAAEAAACAAARAAAWAAECDAARAAAEAAARAAACAAARAAEAAEAAEAARDAEDPAEAAMAAQAEWLRTNTMPNFE